MAYLTAAVVLVGALCLLDLILTLGVIRRLRENSELLRGAPQPGPAGGVPVGQRIGEFTAITTGGELVSREALAGTTLVGFFSPGCEPCATQLPHFVRQARGLPGRVLAVIVQPGGGDPDGGYADQLAPVATVVVEDHGGPVQVAFGVGGFPTLVLVGGDGVVVGSGYTVAGLGEVSSEARAPA